MTEYKALKPNMNGNLNPFLPGAQSFDMVPPEGWGVPHSPSMTFSIVSANGLLAPMYEGV